MKPFSLLFLADFRQCTVKDAVERDHNQDQDIAIVLCLVHWHYETKAFHQKCDHEQPRDQNAQSLLAHLQWLEQEIGHLIRPVDLGHLVMRRRHLTRRVKRGSQPASRALPSRYLRFRTDLICIITEGHCIILRASLAVISRSTVLGHTILRLLSLLLMLIHMIFLVALDHLSQFVELIWSIYSSTVSNFWFFLDFIDFLIWLVLH